jgi:hypothetical protein|tara:strand:+ start:1741 stop:1860 length:120 start_codon:yes stop_codon:yes gene_type:complete
METIMWLGLAAIALVLGKFIGKLLWPEDWEDFDNNDYRY